MTTDLDQQAIDILKRNDRGGFTIPTARQYPYQWNWDSAFVALGFATFDPDRAWREVELLLQGQWPNGMIPNILFRSDDPDYFPGPSVWQTPQVGPADAPFSTSGVSQPPVLATVVSDLIRSTGDTQRGAAMFDGLLSYHRWFHRDRTPNGFPAIATVHPWESGRDNCPDWETGLDAMTVDPDLGAYKRRDNIHSDTAQRPSDHQYDCYLSIVKFGRDHGWDQAVLTNDGPFLMADPGLHFFLLRADRDLLGLARRFARHDAIAEIEAWIGAAEAATDAFWNPELRAFTARDVRTGAFSNGFSSASALCFFANAGSAEQRAATLDHIRRIKDRARFLLPSWDPDHALFQPKRYWCGPLWPQMNYVASRGLEEQGEYELAENVREDLASVIRSAGFFECFDPLTGEGCLGNSFSWTAALWLAWASPGKHSIAA